MADVAPHEISFHNLPGLFNSGTAARKVLATGRLDMAAGTAQFNVKTYNSGVSQVEGIFYHTQGNGSIGSARTSGSAVFNVGTVTLTSAAAGSAYFGLVCRLDYV